MFYFFEKKNIFVKKYIKQKSKTKKKYKKMSHKKIEKEEKITCKKVCCGWIGFLFSLFIFILISIMSQKINVLFVFPIHMYLFGLYPRWLGNFVYKIIGVYIYNLLKKLYQKATCKNMFLCCCISNLLWIFFVLTLAFIVKFYLLYKQKYIDL
jgi:uncharacterized membrane protein